MRKIILFIATSLDGFIAGPSGEIDWLFTDQDYGYKAFYEGIDLLIMGRKTYEQALTFGEYPFHGKGTFVVSRTRAGTRDEHAIFVSSDVVETVRTIMTKPGKHIWLVGGAEIVQLFLNHDLIDEFVISIHPIILGRGIPLFPAPLPRKALKLIRNESFDTGLVQLTYTPL